MSHEQLISKSRYDLSEVIRVFHELNAVYQSQFCIYMDSQVWELFDTRTAKTIIKHDFNHFRQFKIDMIKLMHDIINVGCVNYSIGRNRKPKPTEIWSIKSIIKYYGIDDDYFFSNKHLQNYIIYGLIKKS